MEDGKYLPEKVLKLFPSVTDLVPSYNCKTCSTKHCCCREAGLKCISFCACNSMESARSFNFFIPAMTSIILSQNDPNAIYLKRFVESIIQGGFSFKDEIASLESQHVLNTIFPSTISHDDRKIHHCIAFESPRALMREKGETKVCIIDAARGIYIITMGKNHSITGGRRAAAVAPFLRLKYDPRVLQADTFGAHIVRHALHTLYILNTVPPSISIDQARCDRCAFDAPRIGVASALLYYKVRSREYSRWQIYHITSTRHLNYTHVICFVLALYNDRPRVSRASCSREFITSIRIKIVPFPISVYVLLRIDCYHIYCCCRKPTSCCCCCSRATTRRVNQISRELRSRIHTAALYMCIVVMRLCNKKRKITKKVNNEHNPKEHIGTVDSDTIQAYDTSGKNFSTRSNMIRPVKSLHHGIVHSCDICGKSYSQKREYKCNECDMISGRKWNLRARAVLVSSQHNVRVHAEYYTVYDVPAVFLASLISDAALATAIIGHNNGLQQQQQQRCACRVPRIFKPICGSDGVVYVNRYKMLCENKCRGTGRCLLHFRGDGRADTRGGSRHTGPIVRGTSGPGAAHESQSHLPRELLLEVQRDSGHRPDAERVQMLRRRQIRGLVIERVVQGRGGAEKRKSRTRQLLQNAQLLMRKTRSSVQYTIHVKEIIPKIEEPQFKVDVKPESQVNVESSSNSITKSTKKRTVMQKLKSISKSKNN
ncbi:unnamed protein product [Trichogramma brassicae]|uniref:Kazal-like domain-containing protein n=1 Tax=Trichogramma brassicae TaxID=86971 RepID=A0A6H5ISU7_9HYME|nr:unnamed protein product [Trichogramma brassicae]